MLTLLIRANAIFQLLQASQDDLSKESSTLIIFQVSLKPQSMVPIPFMLMVTMTLISFLKELTPSAQVLIMMYLETYMLTLQYPKP